LPWRPARAHRYERGVAELRNAGLGIRGLQTPHSTTPNHYDVAFALPLDGEVRAYQARNGGRTEDGKAVIGCVYLQIFVGNELAVVELAPATSDMSGLFATPSVQRHAISIAAHGDVMAAFFDLEDDDRWELVFPPASSPRRSVPRPAIRHPWSA